jgi:hypothetical protein
MSAVRAGIEHNSVVLKVQEARQEADISAQLLGILDPPLASHEVLICSTCCELNICIHEFFNHQKFDIPWWACLNEECDEHQDAKGRNKTIIWVPEADVIERVVPSVTIDYLFQDPMNQEAARSRGSPATAFVRRTTDSWDVHTPSDDDSDNDSDDEGLPTITPFFQIPPLRAELELRHYTRSHFVDNFVRKPVLSVPFLTFIDGFGLYRNAYRSLMGWYIIIAALTFEERSRRINVHPITLGPHGSNLNDVAKALQPFMLALEGGLEMDICGEKILVCAFSFAYIGDMPQQNKNSGFKGPRANLCCRNCFAVGERGNLQLDVGANGSYHWQTVAMRRKMASLERERHDSQRICDSKWS